MAELLARNSGSAGGTMTLDEMLLTIRDEKLLTIRNSVVEHHENALGSRETTSSLRNAQKQQILLPDASSTVLSSTMLKSPQLPPSDADVSLSTYSSDDDNADYPENRAFISGAHSKSRLAAFAANVAKIKSDAQFQHDDPRAGAEGAGAGVEEVRDASLPRLPDASPPSHSSRSSSSSYIPLSDTENHPPDPARLVENMRDHWTRLRELRVTVLNVLEEIRMKRLELQDIRRQRDRTEKALFVALRANLFEDNPAALEQYLQKCEQARRLDHREVRKFEGLIEDLREAEIDLEILEKGFYSQLARDDSTLPKPDDEVEEDSRPPSRTSLRGIARDRPESFDPLYEEMREAFKDLQLAKEYLHNLTFKRLAMESADSPLGPDATDFLKNFNETEETAKSEIDMWTAKFDELQRECRKRRVVPVGTPFYEDSHGYHPVLIEDISLEDGIPPISSPEAAPDTLAHPIYPILLANPKHVLGDPPLTPKGALKKAISLPKSAPTRARSIATAREEYGIDTLVLDAREGDKNDYINRWLLHKLRISAMEAEVLYSTFCTVLRIIDVGRWQRDVLLFWSRDKAVMEGMQNVDGRESSAAHPFIDLDSYAVSESHFPGQFNPQTQTPSESIRGRTRKGNVHGQDP